MKNLELYNKTVDILFQAYFKGELEHGLCHACAVGNILKEAAAKVGVSNKRWAVKFITLLSEDYTHGSRQLIAGKSELLFANMLFGHYARTAENDNEVEILNEANLLLENSPYPIEDLIKIEAAFEKGYCGQKRDDEEWMFNGLVAVLDVLKQIHEVENDEPVKTKFKNHYQTLTV